MISGLVRKGRDFTVDDQQMLGRKQIEVIGKVIPVYREFAARSRSKYPRRPFYHPILPLICDSRSRKWRILRAAAEPVPVSAGCAHQLQTACVYMDNRIGIHPAGLGHRRDRSRMKCCISPPRRVSNGLQRTTECLAERSDRILCRRSRIDPTCGSRVSTRCTGSSAIITSAT